jgi:flagellar hook-associated protein 2
VYIYSASSAIKTALGINPAGSSSDTSLTSFTFDPDTAVKTVSTVDYLNQKGFTISLDGTSKTVKGPTQAELIQKAEKEGRDTWNTNDYIDLLQEKIDAAFGSGKISVTNALAEDEETAESNMKFQFEVLGDTASTLLVKSSAGEAVGISGSLSNYVDTSSKLGDLLDLDDYDAKLDEYGRADTDSDGNTIYTVTINGVDFDVTKDTTLSSLMSKINSSDEANVSVSYSKTTQKFSIAASETGASGKVSIDSDLAEAIFGKVRTEDEEDEDGNILKANMTEGQDAKLTAIVNGETVNLTRSSNSVSIDGLSLTLKGTFEATNDDEIVTFSTSVDTEKIVSAVKSMISDYNAIVTAVKSAYTTYPAQKSDGSSYEPLSEDDKADMSDTAIENYEAKAKQGLLFMDSDLSSLYSALTNCFSSSSLKSIGITSSYSDGLTTISLDESTFTQALQDDPDKVRDLFAGSDSSDGLMTKLSTVCSKYARTTGATKGILIEKAGSSLASSTLTTNTWYKAITSLEEQITKWQDRLSDKVDYYTTQFTNLETLISEMNSQSSMLSGLSGGY